MGKTKNLEKKDKTANAFEKKTPSSRVKSLNNEPKKAKTEKNDSDNIKTLLKKNKKEVMKALKAKASLTADITKSDKEPAVAPTELANEDTIEKAVIALRQGLEKEAASAESKGLFDEETRFGVQVVAMKIPDVPPQARRILLDYSLLSDPVDICFIVRDTASKKTADHDKTIAAMAAKLKELGVTDIKTILPLSKLKEDYGPNNMKIKLLHMYDLFLVESEIAEHTYTILGKHFITKRKRPAQIDLSKTETVLTSIEHAKRKVSFKLGPSSNTSFIEVGTVKMSVEQSVANVKATLEQLKDKYPGGWLNIKKLLLKPGKISKVIIPLYYSKITPNEVSVPKEKGSKALRVEKLANEVTKKSKLIKMDKASKKLMKVGGKPQQKKPAVDGSPAKGKKNKGKPQADGSPDKKNKKDKKKSHITGDDEATKEARSLDRAEKKLKFKKQIEKKMAKKAAKLAEKKPNAPGTPKTETTEATEVNKINKQKDKKKAKKAKKADNALNESKAETVVEKPAGEKKKKKKAKKEAAE